MAFRPGPALIALVLALAAGCARPEDFPRTEIAPEARGALPEIPPRRRLARALTRAMTTEEKCAQLLMIAVGIHARPPEDFPRLIKEVPAGAILLLGYNIAETPGEIMRLTAAFQKTAGLSGKGIPFFIAIDHEGGSVYRLGKAATRIPGASRAGALLEKALQDGPDGELEVLLSIAASRIDGNNPKETQEAYAELLELLRIHPEHPGIAKALHTAELVLGIRPPLSGLRSIEESTRPFPALTKAAALAALYRASARQLSLLGFSLNLAPVLEPLTGANKDFLSGRSYGAGARTASLAGGIFTAAMREGGVLAAGKHFPGTGSADPHEKLARLALSLPPEAGAQPPAEIQPFAAAITRYGLRALMVSHVLAPALDPDLPVSLSASAFSYLRDVLGFTGIILTDDVNMGAVSTDRSPEEAAVMAIAAGADMIMYLDERGIQKVHAALVRAVREGRLPEARVDEAAARIIEEKLVLELWKKTLELTEASADNPSLARRLYEFTRVKKEADALAASLR
jgi:beta-N-acetylhexosaminidase